LLLFVISAAVVAVAKSPCPTQVLQGSLAAHSGDLICIVPQLYGPGGLVGTNNGGPLTPTTGHEVHFQDSNLSSFGAVNAAIGVQVSQIPIGSPVSGFIFTAGALQPVESFGPILTDRAETIGKHKIYLGFSYQFFNFDGVDGVNLKQFGAVFTHEPEPTVCQTQPTVPCIVVNGQLQPIYTQDVVSTLNRIDLKINQYAIVGTYGLTNKLDVSLLVPILNVRMGMFSNATIFNFEPPPVNHSFGAPLAPYSANFVDHNSKSGIGDLTLRGKFLAWQDSKEKSAVAVGLDIWLPTGNAYDFLGSGTWGVRPWANYTYSGRVSPHASVGFQGNGSSVLAGDVTTQPVTKAQLPNVFTYSAGADAQIFRWLSASGAFIGQSLLNAQRIKADTFTDYAGTPHQNITTYTGTVNQESIALGGKVEPISKLLVSLNVLFRVNNAGLHSKPAPLIGISYLF